MSNDESKKSAVELLNLIQERQATKSPELAAKQARLIALLKADLKAGIEVGQEAAPRSQAESPSPGGPDHILAYMKAHGLPLTRQTYLDLNETPEPLDAELEQMLPREFRKA